MGRYWLFGFNEDRPQGGYNDMVCACDSLDGLKELIKIEEEGNKFIYRVDCKQRFEGVKYFDKIQVVDTLTGNLLFII